MLKKYLLGLFVGFVGFIGFSNAGSYTFSGNYTGQPAKNSPLISISIPQYKQEAIPFDIICNISNYTGEDITVGNILVGSKESHYYNSSSLSAPNFNNIFKLGNTYTKTVNSAGYKIYGYINIYSTSVASSSISFDWICILTGTNIIDQVNCPVCQECQECSEVNTGDILSGSCDINYCVENGLCPTSSGSRSELKINDIVHEGKPLINVSIPDYIYWDYSTDENQFDLYVGSGYNQDYIDSILAINSYRPDNEDFTNIFVSGLTLIFPYIFVALLILFIWKLLKRIFK